MISSISFRVRSRVCGSMAATRAGVKACCIRPRTRVCLGGSSRSRVSRFISSPAPGTGGECSNWTEKVLKSRRIASHSAQRRNPGLPTGSTRQTGPLARSSARSRLPSTVKLGLRRSRTGSASKPAGTGLFTLAAMFFLRGLQRRKSQSPPLTSHTLKHHSVLLGVRESTGQGRGAKHTGDEQQAAAKHHGSQELIFLSAQAAADDAHESEKSDPGKRHEVERNTYRVPAARDGQPADR